jgi:hypothetical protein
VLTTENGREGPTVHVLGMIVTFAAHAIGSTSWPAVIVTLSRARTVVDIASS